MTQTCVALVAFLFPVANSPDPGNAARECFRMPSHGPCLESRCPCLGHY